MDTAELIRQVRVRTDRQDRYGNVATPPIFMVQNTDHFRQAVRYATAEFQTNADYEYGSGQRPLLDYNLRTVMSPKFAQLKAAIRRVSAIGGTGSTPVDAYGNSYIEEDEQPYDITPINGDDEDIFEEDEETW